MLRNCFSILLARLLSQIVIAPAHIVSAQTGRDAGIETDARLIAKVKADAASFGFGPDARVKVKLRDGRKLKCYISRTDDEKFAISNDNAGATTTLAYTEVAEVKGNKGLSTRAAIFTGVGITFGSLMVLGLILNGGG